MPSQLWSILQKTCKKKDVGLSNLPKLNDLTSCLPGGLLIKRFYQATCIRWAYLICRKSKLSVSQQLDCCQQSDVGINVAFGQKGGG